MRLSYFIQCAFKVQTAALFHENFAMRLIVTRRSIFFPISSTLIYYRYYLSCSS